MMELHFILFIFMVAVNGFENHNQTLSTNYDEQNQPVSIQASISTLPSGFQTFCNKIILDRKDVNVLSNGNMFIAAYNVTVRPSNMNIIENGRETCFLATTALKKIVFQRCGKFQYNPDEFQLLSNGSIVLINTLLEDGVLYEINEEGKLVLCSTDYDDVGEEDFINLLPTPMHDVETASTYIGKIGSITSIFALLVHIATFCLVPSLRNLPGYNLLSLSIAFLMAYFFTLIGQIRQVLGTACVISAALQQYFFLVAFFWMNVMAFDVWKTLRMATERLVIGTRTARRRQFLWYSLYAWLVPMCIVAATVGVDNSKNVSDKFKPLFGQSNLCWFLNDVAKGIFFCLPAFVLILINAVFFVLSAFILKNNTMKQANDCDYQQTAKFNFILYVRLSVMMGVPWLLGALGIILSNNSFSRDGPDTVVWFLYDIANSLQGLFVFLLFTCSRKVYKHLVDKMRLSTFKMETDKHTISDSTKSNHNFTEHDLKKTDL